jgi:hypothetical protein
VARSMYTSAVRVPLQSVVANLEPRFEASGRILGGGQESSKLRTNAAKSCIFSGARLQLRAMKVTLAQLYETTRFRNGRYVALLRPDLAVS